jgi:hypothetical protein
LTSKTQLDALGLIIFKHAFLFIVILLNRGIKATCYKG